MPTPTASAQDDLAPVLELKGGTTISVCLPARDEAATIGPIVECLAELSEQGAVDEVVVVDDHSSDGTAAVAAAAGARVVDAEAVLGDVARGHGKGEALWRSLHVSSGDLVVWCDADITGFGPHFVTRLVTPLLSDPGTQFVKGYYERPEAAGTGGGRVTELVARPVLSMLFPQLAHVRQPLGGEYAGRRSALESLPFVRGYGVDLGLLIDVAATWGPDAVAQADLGTRVHRNRTLAELSPQATAVLQVALRRADPDLVGAVVQLTDADGEQVEVDGGELPPLREVRREPTRQRAPQQARR